MLGQWGQYSDKWKVSNWEALLRTHPDRGLDGAFTLWKQMLLALKEKYPLKEDLLPELKKWTIREKGIHYLREFAMIKMLHDPTSIPENLHQEHDPERGRYTPSQVCGKNS